MTIDTPAPDDERIQRTDTGVRALLTLLFVLIARVVEMVLLAVIVFELLYALVTERRPSDEVRRFANRALSYLVALVRYATYNEDEAPFPLDAFPPERDLSARAAASDPG